MIEPFNTYQLHIVVAAPVSVETGRLGVFEFPAGRYIYSGSARRNFEARIARHLRGEKKLRWHIDYLLANSNVSVVDVTRHITAECQLNQSVRGRIIVSGFGSSDCHAGCGSHLKRVTG